MAAGGRPAPVVARVCDALPVATPAGRRPRGCATLGETLRPRTGVMADLRLTLPQALRVLGHHPEFTLRRAAHAMVSAANLEDRARSIFAASLLVRFAITKGSLQLPATAARNVWAGLQKSLQVDVPEMDFDVLADFFDQAGVLLPVATIRAGLDQHTRSIDPAATCMLFSDFAAFLGKTAPGGDLRAEIATDTLVWALVNVLVEEDRYEADLWRVIFGEIEDRSLPNLVATIHGIDPRVTHADVEARWVQAYGLGMTADTFTAAMRGCLSLRTLESLSIAERVGT